MKYTVIFFSSFLFAITTIAGINWFIDPFGMYWSPTVSNINQQKTEAGTRVRLVKAYRPAMVNPTVLLVGNSRVEMGLNPQHPIFAGQTVYNQAMPGAGVAHQVKYALEVIEKNPDLKQIIMGLDILDFFLTYRTDRKLPQSIQTSSQEWYEEMHNIAPLLFSLDTFISSLHTITKQGHNANSINAQGFNTAAGYIDIMKYEGIVVLFQQKYNQLVNQLHKQNYYIEKEVNKSPQLAALTQLLQETNKRNIDVQFFINPYHYSYLHILDEAGYWAHFNDWKQLITTFFSDRDTPPTVWDFSGFNHFTNERLPFEKIHQPMDWYWEPAHYKQELGDIILTTMLASSNGPPSFGQKLTPLTISDVIKEDRSGLQDTKQQWQKLKQTLLPSG